MREEKICHITSVHSRYDIRIFIKECSSLASQYKVFLIVADGKGNEEKNNISILDVGRAKNRLDRIFFTRNKILKKIKSFHSDVYHLHDPELLSLANKLKKNGKKVVFDAHEDFPKQILSKTYLAPILAKILSWSAYFYESMVFKRIDAIVCATPAIEKKISKYNKNTISICNYPILSELYSDSVVFESRFKQACYVGGISFARGIKQIVDATHVLLNGGFLEKNTVVAGKILDFSVRDILEKREGYDYVDFVGELNREEIKLLLSQSYLGLVTLLATPNHLESLPIKMFEYMSAGIPVIASNFPLWKEIIESNNCGICVDQNSPDSISAAIKFLFSHPDIAEKMGKNGRIAVNKKYNWECESKKLLNLYDNLFSF